MHLSRLPINLYSELTMSSEFREPLSHEWAEFNLPSKSDLDLIRQLNMSEYKTSQHE